MKSYQIRMKVGLLLLGLVAGSMVLGQQPFVELTTGQRVAVERILARPDGSLVVFRDGEPTELQRDQYVRAVGVRPPELAEASELLVEGRKEEAVSKLETVMRQSQFQTWDVVAGISLANAQIEDDNPSAARRILGQLTDRYGESSYEMFPELRQIDWRVRMATGQVEGLEEDLTELIRSHENRGQSAIALITRGDMKVDRDNLREAVLDYLRAVYFFRDEGQIHAEALYKASRTFRDLGETANARKYESQLQELHPNSEFAIRLQASES